jgi:flagellar assembly factor FliW
VFRPKKRKRIVIESERIGRIAVDPDMVISLVGGGNGSKAPREFVLVGIERLSPFLFLVSVERPNTSCAIIDPRNVLPNYRPAVSAEDLQTIGSTCTDSVEVITFVEIDQNKGSAVLDLKHPILINVKGKVAKQIVVPGNPESFEIPAALLRQ